MPGLRRRGRASRGADLGDRKRNAVFPFSRGAKCQDRRRFVVFRLALCRAGRLDRSSAREKWCLFHGSIARQGKRSDAIYIESPRIRSERKKTANVQRSTLNAQWKLPGGELNSRPTPNAFGLLYFCKQ